MIAAEPLFVSPAEAARLSGLCIATIYNRMNDGTLAARKCGRRRLIEYKSLLNLGQAA